MENSAVIHQTEGEESKPLRLKVVVGNLEHRQNPAPPRQVEPADAPSPAGDAPPGDEITASDALGQTILGAVNSAIESMRRRMEADARQLRADSAALIESARTETVETVGQLTMALDQIRYLRGQVETLMRQNSALPQLEETIRDLELQLAEEKSRAAETQERLIVIGEGRAAAEGAAAKARAAAEAAKREAATLVAALAALREGPDGLSPPMGPHVAEIDRTTSMNALMPIQITAVVDALEAEAGKTGIGIVFDIRIAAAAPLDLTQATDPAQQVIERVITLARTMYPTALLTVAFGSPEDHESAMDRHPDVHFEVPAESDDRRRKAAHVLASAARNLSQ